MWEHRDGAPRERLAPDRAVEILQALRPTADKRAQQDRGIVLERRAEHGRDGQEEVAIDDALMAHLTDVADPVVDVDCGAPQAQRRLTTHRHQVLPLATGQAAVLDIAHCRRVTTVKHLGHQIIVVGRLVTRMGLLERLPVIGTDVLKDTPGPCGCCQPLRPPSAGGRIVTVPWLYHGASSLSTPPQCVQGSPFHRRGNYLQIKPKKCKFLYDAHSALWAGLQGAISVPIPTAHSRA